LSSSFNAKRAVDATRRLVELVLEISDVWRGKAPIYELSLSDVERLRRALGEAKRLLEELEAMVRRLSHGSNLDV